jgi:ribosomal protein S18 acetylase RimI-like enzyme
MPTMFPTDSGSHHSSLNDGPPTTSAEALRSAEIEIRGFHVADQPACRELYSAGRLGGKLNENDTGLDIDDIAAAYLKKPGSHFWVAQAADGKVIGMIGVRQQEAGIGEIRRLRVAPEYRRRGIGTALVETAVRFCKENENLKVKLDTHVDQVPAMKLFEKFHFRHSRTRTVAGREMHYFYLDLYQKSP